MGATLASLLPLVVGAAVLPLWIIVSLLLAQSEGGVAKAAAFSAGAMTVRVAQGILFGYVVGEAADASGAKGRIASMLLVMLGLVLWITVVRTCLKQDDPDAPPPRWLTALTRVSALQAFGMGALLMAVAIKQWVFTLSALAVLSDADLSRVGGVVVYLLFVVAAQLLVLSPVLVSIAFPSRAASLLGGAQQWLERHSRALTVGMSMVFGSWFLYKGITGLLDDARPPNAAVAIRGGACPPHTGVCRITGWTPLITSALTRS